MQPSWSEELPRPRGCCRVAERSSSAAKFTSGKHEPADADPHYPALMTGLAATMVRPSSEVIRQGGLPVHVE
ncbi:hypothetical protein [Saccharopolyspora spinosa]|uniref:hypothetical protein n=1 Tax=Saccharopolyspora spinosa TaxID=60894 RepID=UPI00376F3956